MDVTSRTIAKHYKSGSETMKSCVKPEKVLIFSRHRTASWCKHSILRHHPPKAETPCQFHMQVNKPQIISKPQKCI